MSRKEIRNIAIIAHVDHGKTSLVDCLLKQSGTMKMEEGAALIMDSNDQEKERWITIYSKNTAVIYNDKLINIIDTPWHADFGSEVQRVLRMVDCVLLVVDAYEGPMPQTKFVLKKSLELGLRPIVVINKIDKPTARPEWVLDQLFELFISLGATDEQADFPHIYASAKNWFAMVNLDDPQIDMKPLFEKILELVQPAPDTSKENFIMQVANLKYDNFVGRMWVGRIYKWKCKVGQTVTVIANDGSKRTGKISKIYTTLGVSQMEAEEWICGDIITIAGIPDIFVWETIGIGEFEALPTISIDEPTMTMEFLVNDSPFAGKEGKYMTTRNLKERLDRELQTNVWLRLDENGGKFVVSGKWELHLGVLIESIRREWREMQAGAPEVIFKMVDGKKHEPIEAIIINVKETLAGAIIEAISNRKGTMMSMNNENGQTTLEFEIPTRWLLGFRAEFILLTKWDGIIYGAFSHYAPHLGIINKRQVGSMISGNTGKAMKYGIFKLQDRGPIFVDPAQDIYEGMIVGEHLKWWDLIINLTTNKQMTNVRNAGNDEAMKLDPIIHMTLEDALWYISTDELVEVTPKNIRIRKKYLTDNARAIAKKNWQL